MRFSDVIGQEELKRRLVYGVDGGRISHAQLFTGLSGYGGLPMAVAYAQYMNCRNKQDGDSCGECVSCRKYEELAHPDLHFVFPVNSAKSSSQKPSSDMFIVQWREMFKATGGYFDEQAWYKAIDIENKQGIISRYEADEVIRKLSFKAFEADYKVMIIWLPEKMRVEAANGLLKILEEPWERTVFIMVSETPYKLLPTIISRTQEVAVPGIDAGNIECYLANKYGGEKERNHAVARLSRGNLLEAQRLITDSSEDDCREYFGLFTQLMRLSYNDKHLELLEWGDSVASLGREQQKKFLEYTMKMLRENYMMNAGMDDITYLWGEELNFSKNFSPFIGNHNIEGLVREVELAVAQIAQNGNPRMIFPHFALAVSKLIIRK